MSRQKAVMFMFFFDSQIPLYNDVRDIVISKRMSVVLVSFEQVRLPYISVPVLHLTGMSRPPPNCGNSRSCGTERTREIN